MWSCIQDDVSAPKIAAQKMNHSNQLQTRAEPPSQELKMSYNERVFCEHNKPFVSKVRLQKLNYVLFKFVAWKSSVLLKFDHRNHKSLVACKICGKMNNTITRVKVPAAKSKDSNEPPDGKQLKLFTGLNLAVPWGCSACINRQTNPPVCPCTHSC